ncbi:hypothetical protein [Streptomyces sp. NRRL S-237]|uniref:hypothetical protein n=1 Tax=Streptomyces sp. NRRL S-237 TaxID=1463895 RepID=UPI0004C555C4|nr:hypothetical protein [Streptomyces sp. NRRL S-237]
MENVWIQPGGSSAPGYTDEQLRRARALAEQDIQASRTQLAARFGLGSICAEIVEQSGLGGISALEPLAKQLGYSANTLDKYRRVTRAAADSFCERLIASPVVVPWKCVTTACITEPAERAHRVGLLLGRLGSAERAGWPAVLDAAEYCRALGLADGSGDGQESTPSAIVAHLDRKDVREAVLAELTKTPTAALAVLQAPAVREVLKDQGVARYVREQMRPAPDPDEDLLHKLIGADTRDPRADWTIRYFDLAHRCREILLLGPEDFLDVDDPDVWESVESFRESVTSWADRVLQKRPRKMRLVPGK